jgi:hypothetical protein
MLESAGPPGAPLRAGLSLGGVVLGRHQLALMLALGCQRVVCIAARVDPALIELQHLAEEAGARFHVVPGPHGLLGTVTTADEVVALADGLLAWPESARALIEAGPAVLVQPAEAGLAAGFERIDADHAAAGAMRIPGRLVERLADLPPDVDAFAALQRIALQAGIPARLLPDGLLSTGRWQLLLDDAAAQAAEAQWVAAYSAAPGSEWPSRSLARWLVRRYGPTLLHAGSGAGAVALAALVVSMLALAARGFALASVGFVLAAFAALLFELVGLIAGVEARARLEAPRLSLTVLAGGWAGDLLLLVLAAAAMPPLPGTGLSARLFAPLMLLGTLRLVGTVATRRWAVWLGDRVLLALALAVAAHFGLAPHLIAAAALAVLAAGLASVGGASQG